MTIVQSITAPQPAGVTDANDAKDLAQFGEVGTSATVWHRDMPQDAQVWLETLNPALLPSGRVVLPIDQVAPTVSQLCEISQLPQGPERDWLEADVAMLARTFAEMMNSDYLRMRLDVVTTNACRKFHVDAIVGRLVCTYRGTGTQYGTSDGCCDPKAVFTVPTGSPIFLRGTLWPAKPPSGLVHRSPPIEGSGETRLVLVLDPVNDPIIEDDPYVTH